MDRKTGRCKTEDALFEAYGFHDQLSGYQRFLAMFFGSVSTTNVPCQCAEFEFKFEL